MTVTETLGLRPVRRWRAMAGPLARLRARLALRSTVTVHDLPLWCPVAFAAGAAVYFTLPAEPPPAAGWTALGLAILSASMAIILRHRTGLFIALLLSAFILAGAARGQWRTHQQAGPVIAPAERARTVTGWIEAVQQSGGRDRLILRVTAIDGLTDPPRRVRVNASRGEFSPGDGVTLRAVLGPPPRPAAPGGYDSGFAAHFAGLGGTGYAVTRPERAVITGDDRARALVRLRWQIAERIRSRAPPRSAGIAAALLTGDRSGIRPEDAEALRATGLGHILAISGLHMALFAGGVFFAVRLLIAAMEPFARRHDPRIPAAIAALLAALAYLVLSGAAIPTQRAFIMTAAVLIGVLVGRQALSMRSVALAALAVLLIQPESIVTPGFQMSFAAAAALIAAFEFARRRYTPGPRPGLVRRAAGTFGTIAYSSLIAGAATSGFAAFHFNRLAAFGFLANLAAMPIFSLIVMPAGVIALALMPFGLDAIPLAVMGAGLDAVLEIAHFIAGWPGALTPVPAGSGLALPVYAAGFAALVAGRGVVRLGGIALMATGLVTWAASPQPDGLITDSGVVIARYDNNPDQWAASSTRRSRFAARVFLEQTGGGTTRLASGMACDAYGCTGTAGDVLIAVPDDEEILLEDCRRADLVVTRLVVNRALRARCGAELIDGTDLARDGARTFRISEGKITHWQTVEQVRGNRPWTRQHNRSGN